MTRKKLTLTIDEEVYEGLHTVVSRAKISRFIEDLVRPYVVQQDLEAAYQEMAQDMADQITTVSKLRLREREAVLTAADMRRVEQAVNWSFWMDCNTQEKPGSCLSTAAGTRLF